MMRSGEHKGPAYTDEQDEFLRARLKEGMTANEVAAAMAMAFGVKRSHNSIISRARRTEASKKNYTAEHDAFLRAHVAPGVSAQKIAALFNREFGLARSIPSVGARARYIGLRLDGNANGMAGRARMARDARSAVKPMASCGAPSFALRAGDTEFDRGEVEGKTFFDLRAGECKWPRGDQPSSFRFCSDPTGGGDVPYCAHHRRKAVGPGTHGERGAIRAAQHAS